MYLIDNDYAVINLFITHYPHLIGYIHGGFTGWPIDILKVNF